MYTQVTEAIGAVMSGKLLCSGDCQGVMNKLVVAVNEAGILAIEQNFGGEAPSDALANADFDDEGSKVEEFMPKCICAIDYGSIFARARTTGVALVTKMVDKLTQFSGEAGDDDPPEYVIGRLIDGGMLSVAVKPFLKELLSKGAPGLMSEQGLCSGDCRAMTSWLIKMELSIWTSLPLDGGLGAGLLEMAGGAAGLAAGAVGLRDRRHLRAADGTEYRLLPGRRLAPTVYKDTIYAIGDSSVTCICDYFDVDKALDGLDMLDEEFFSSRRQLNHERGSGGGSSYSYGDDGIDLSVVFTEQNLRVAKAVLVFLLSQDGLCAAGAGDGCLMMQTSIATLTGQLEANHVEGGVLKSTGILLATPNPSMESMLVTAPPCWCSPAFDVSSLIDAITTGVNEAPQRIPSIFGISSISDEIPSILTEAMSVSGMCQTDHCKVMTNAVFDVFSGIMPSSSAVCTSENAGKCRAGATASGCPNPPIQQSWMGQEAISMGSSMGLSTWEMEMGYNLPGSIWPHVFWPVCFAQQYCPTVAGATVEITLTASGSVSDYSDSDTLILQLRSSIATAAGVDESLVTIRVTAASVIITATIFVPAGTTAAAVKDLLSASLGTAAAASALLGITVESVPTMVSTAPSPPPPSPPPSPEAPQESNAPSSDSINVGVIVGAIAGGLAFVLLMIVIAVCAMKRSSNEATRQVTMAKAPQQIELTATP